MAPKKSPAKKKEETYEVEAVVDKRGSGKKVEYLVKWVGYSAKENTWEPTSNLKAVEDLIEAFENPPKKKAAAPAKKRAKEPEPEPPAKKAKAAAPKIDVSEIAKLLRGAIKDAKPEKPAKAEKAAPKAAEKAAAKPAEKKGKKSKVPDDVVEVEKITAMRITSKGTIEYQVVWKVGKNTWEPYDNIMDDDLVDEFEEEQQIKMYGSDDIKNGSQVEVKNEMEGFQNSWTVATVTSKKGDKFSVSYDKFVDEKGNAETEKGVDRSRLRLVPDKVSGWTAVEGEIIEVNEDDCWWEATVQSKSGKSLSVMYRVSDEVKNVTMGAKTRPCSWLKLIGKKA